MHKVYFTEEAIQNDSLKSILDYKVKNRIKHFLRLLDTIEIDRINKKIIRELFLDSINGYHRNVLNIVNESNGRQ